MMLSKLSPVSSVLLGLLLFSSSTALAQNSLGPKLTQALEDSSEQSTVAVIVKLVEQLDLGPFVGVEKGLRRAQMVQALKAHAAASQKPVLQLLETAGIEGAVSLWAINAVAVQAPPGIVRALAALPGVASVELDASIEEPAPQASTASTPEWNIDSIRAPELWALGHSGVGTVIAILDSGVDADHPDLASRWRAGAGGWYDPNGEHVSPHDSSGHGTQALGLAVGGDAGGSSIGVAPGAQWIAVKIFNDAGQASLSGIHQGFQWLLDPDGNPGTDDAPDVVNNSWNLQGTFNECNTEFQPDIDLLEAAGIVVIFSAGNQGPYPGSSLSPANNSGVLASGAVDAGFSVAESSSRGPGACDGGTYPQLVAPGVNVRTSDLTFNGTFPNSFISVSGSSFAAPHVTGAIALLLGAVSGASGAQARQALEASAVDLGSVGPDNDYGHGLIDLVEAFDLLGSAPPPPPPDCADADGDGFSAGADCAEPIDCDDADPDIHPGACDVKRDGVDQDCDGSDRRGGPACPDPGAGGSGGTGGSGGGGGTVEPEGKGRTCSDGIDNDADGLIDCGDPECSKNQSCR